MPLAAVASGSLEAQNACHTNGGDGGAAYAITGHIAQGLTVERAFVPRLHMAPDPTTWGFIAWTPELGLIAADFGGVIRRADDAMGEWTEVARLDGSPAALEAAGRELLAATHDARVLSSRDGGAGWQELLGKD